jgi:ATP-binding cassette subfamily B protein
MARHFIGPPGAVSVAFERPTTSAVAMLKRLRGYLSPYRLHILLTVFLSVGANILALAGPKLSGYAVDAIALGAGKVDFAAVFYYCALMLIFYLASSALNYLLAIMMVRLSRKVVTNIRQDAYNHIIHLPVRFLDSAGAGDILSVLSYDIDTINASLSHDLVQMLASVITVLGSLWMMLTISPPLVLIFAVAIPVTVYVTKRRSARSRSLYRERSQELGALNAYTEEAVGGLRSIKAYHAQQAFRDRFEDHNGTACQATYEAESFTAVTGPSVNFINNISLALVSVFGGMLAMSGAVTLGGISSFVLYSRKFSGPINEFSNIISELQSALAAAERVFHLLEQPLESADLPEAYPLERGEVKGGVEIKNISFCYNAGVPVLKDVSFCAKPGQTVAIVGSTGAGKTTVINLLMRFYDADAGHILLDGRDLRTLRRVSLRNAFSMVLQETWLFSGTIAENLSYGKENVTREQVVAAAKTAHIHTYIEALPLGYETPLANCGENISKGQKQLLTIARAMLLDAPILILDEATSNVDTQTERSIQAAMLGLMRGRTCFVIAHRLSTIRDADCIVVMKEGGVAESGSHSELMRANGVYAELYKAQFDLDEIDSR